MQTSIINRSPQIKKAKQNKEYAQLDIGLLKAIRFKDKDSNGNPIGCRSELQKGLRAASVRLLQAASLHGEIGLMQQQSVPFSSIQSHRAFSLVELVIVLAIIGLVAAMAVPRFANATVRSRVDAAAKRIAADLELARTYAIHSSTPQTVTFKGNFYVISSIRDLDHPTSSYKVDLSSDPYQVNIRLVDFGGDSEVTFDIYGNADSSGTVVIRDARYERTIQFDADTGQATVE